MNWGKSVAALAVALAMSASMAWAQTAVEASFDRGVADIMKRYDIPGASLAIARDGKLVLARSYGLANRETREPVTANTRFRLASLSKPITSAAVLALVGSGRVSLDASIATLLGVAADPAVPSHAIKLRHLLQHTAAWGPATAEISWDYLAPLLRRAGATNYDTTPFHVLAVAALADAPRSAPGTVYGYSTFGYCALGAIVQRLTGLSYQEAARREILGPAGAASFALASGFGEWPLSNEAHTYDYANAPMSRRMVGGNMMDVPRPQAYWPVDRDQTCAAGGRWVATPRDYLKVTTSLGRRRAPAVGDAAAMGLLFDSASAVRSGRSNESFTHGLFVERFPDAVYWSHTGGYAGTATAYGRNSAGFEWVVFYNSRPQADQIYPDTYRAIWPTIRATAAWPAGQPL